MRNYNNGRRSENETVKERSSLSALLISFTCKYRGEVVLSCWARRNTHCKHWSFSFFISFFLETLLERKRGTFIYHKRNIVLLSSSFWCIPYLLTCSYGPETSFSYAHISLPSFSKEKMAYYEPKLIIPAYRVNSAFPSAPLPPLPLFSIGLELSLWLWRLSIPVPFLARRSFALLHRDTRT